MQNCGSEPDPFPDFNLAVMVELTDPVIRLG
jgi:hypothetical protein